jgi:hypothetical protein
VKCSYCADLDDVISLDVLITSLYFIETLAHVISVPDMFKFSFHFHFLLFCSFQFCIFVLRFNFRSILYQLSELYNLNFTVSGIYETCSQITQLLVMEHWVYFTFSTSFS